MPTIPEGKAVSCYLEDLMVGDHIVEVNGIAGKRPLVVRNILTRLVGRSVETNGPTLFLNNFDKVKILWKES